MGHSHINTCSLLVCDQGYREICSKHGRAHIRCSKGAHLPVPFSMTILIFVQIYKGRRRPSRSRLQYLLCLEDSCRISLQGLLDTAALIEDTTNATESRFSEMKQDLREWFEKSKNDVKYLQGELRAAHQRILDVRSMVSYNNAIWIRSI